MHFVAEVFTGEADGQGQFADFGVVGREDVIDRSGRQGEPVAACVAHTP